MAWKPCEDQFITPAPIPHQVRLYLAAREMRLHHYLWHGARGGWLTTFSEQTKERFRAIGWEPPRPARRIGPDGKVQSILDNDSGEDFLYMHRQMIATVNEQLATIAEPTYPRVEGWTQVPAPGDRDYPVPPAFEIPGDSDTSAYIASRKTDDFYKATLVPWERQYADSAYLRSVSLGRLGTELEFTIHNAMHMRWCSPIQQERPEPAADDDPRGIAPIWDDPSYDWLGDTYSSHVNDVFWKLHGWVDTHIDLWAKANDLSNVDWKGTWQGPHEHAPHPGPGPHHAMLAEDRDQSDAHLAEIEDLIKAVRDPIPSGFPPR